jgi:hypothetical protein
MPLRKETIVKRRSVFLSLLILLSGLSGTVLSAQQTTGTTDWKHTLAERLPLLGHRNWILVVDSAYPLQTSPGLEVIETNADQVDVTKEVLAQIKVSIHVRPTIFMDAELPFLTEEDSPGANAYRQQIAATLHEYDVQNELHEKLIATVSSTSKDFKILVLKTRLAVPYTSVFIRLDCKYVSADAEKRLRARMKAARPR